jgi:hypothetical protein
MVPGDDQPEHHANERARHNRLALALEDLQEARHYAMYLADKRADDPIIKDALAAAMIVAYGRAFSGAKGKHREAIAGLPQRLCRGLDRGQRALHARLIKLRHEEFAHSDADAAEITMTRFVLPDETFVGPDQRKLRVGLGALELESAIGLISHLIVTTIGEMAAIQARFRDDGEIPTQRIGLPRTS